MWYFQYNFPQFWFQKNMIYYTQLVEIYYRASSRCISFDMKYNVFFYIHINIKSIDLQMETQVYSFEQNVKYWRTKNAKKKGVLTNSLSFIVLDAENRIRNMNACIWIINRKRQSKSNNWKKSISNIWKVKSL